MPKIMSVCDRKMFLCLILVLRLVSVAFGYVSSSNRNDEHYFRHQQHSNQRIEQLLNNYKASQQTHHNFTHLRHHKSDDTSRSLPSPSAKSSGSLTSVYSQHRLRHYNPHNYNNNRMWEGHDILSPLPYETQATTPTTTTTSLSHTSDKSSLSTRTTYDLGNVMNRRYFDRDGLYSLTKTKNNFATLGPNSKSRDSHSASSLGHNKYTNGKKSAAAKIENDRIYDADSKFSYYDDSQSDEEDRFNHRNDRSDRSDRSDRIDRSDRSDRSDNERKKSADSADDNMDDYFEDEEADDDDGEEEVEGDEEGDGEDDDEDDGEGEDEGDEDRSSSEDVERLDRTYSNKVDHRSSTHQNVEEIDIHSPSYVPGVFTEHKFETLGTHRAVQHSHRAYLRNQQHNKKLANHHMNKIFAEARCKWPKPKVEKIQKDPSKLYTPHCTILHRCGDDTGCCSEDTMTCTAKRVENIELFFFVNTLGSNYGTIERHTFINHTECHCVHRSSHQILVPPAAMMRKATILDCNCPKSFEKVLQDDGVCRCDCSSGNSDCDWLKRGMEHFSMSDRKCILEGRCKLPTCEYGSYVRKHGRCPKKEDKLSFSRSYH